MMSQEQNDLITRIGPQAPAGKLMRMYWQPAALVDEMQGSRPIKPVKLLGEDFVLFRDEAGRYGLLDRDCPHRGADLAFGRLEGGGVRCAFHGWLFDVQGNCLETPAEPASSKLCANIKQRAFPVVEKGGMLWAYLGEGEPPAFPELDCFTAPGSHTFAFKGLYDCNWLQALEVGIDPAHASFLHRFFEDEDTSASYGKQFRGASAGSEMPMTKILREYDRPIINVESTEFGLRLIALRQLDDERTHVRVTNQLFPHGFVIPMSTEMTITQWHVPVDDESCYWYAIFTSYTKPVDKQKMRDAEAGAVRTAGTIASRKNRSNDYGFDPSMNRNDGDLHRHGRPTSTCTTNGPWNRWVKHPEIAHASISAQTDKAIIQYRRLLRRADRKSVEGGQEPMLFLDEANARKGDPRVRPRWTASDRRAGWETYWMEVDVEATPQVRRGWRASAEPLAAGRSNNIVHASVGRRMSVAMTFVEQHGLWSVGRSNDLQAARDQAHRIDATWARGCSASRFPISTGSCEAKTLIARRGDPRCLAKRRALMTSTLLREGHLAPNCVSRVHGRRRLWHDGDAGRGRHPHDPRSQAPFKRAAMGAEKTGWLLCDLHFAERQTRAVCDEGYPQKSRCSAIVASIATIDFMAGVEVECHIFKLEDAKMASRMNQAGQPGSNRLP